MRKIQTQGFHHITINGANCQRPFDFWSASQASLSDDRSPKNPY